MRFGGPLPWRGPWSTPDELVRAATTVEGLGYEWVTAGEHLLYPKAVLSRHPRDNRSPIYDGYNSHELFTLFSWLAASTSTLRFMTAMLVVPYRSPFVTAKLAAEVDYLSGGRLTLGVAVGWMQEEFEAFGIPFAERGRRTDESLLILQTLFADGGPFQGRYYSFPENWFEPKPLQHPLPIVVGGQPVDAVLRRVARFGQGWWPYPVTTADIAAAQPLLRAHMATAGREADLLAVHTYGTFGIDGKRNRDQVLESLAASASAGVTHLTLTVGELGADPRVNSLDAVLEAAAWFATNVMPEATKL